MVGILRNRRGFWGKERKGHPVVVPWWDLEEVVKKEHTESAVRKRSGKLGRLMMDCDGGGVDISTAVVVFRVQVMILMMGFVWGGGGEVHGGWVGEEEEKRKG
ncbi:hypothetical protein SESBI_16163 [Sesbania bispinosa]|nr:hypothetical protein SESBI_16163 [Sesbania bispinosa]